MLKGMSQYFQVCDRMELGRAYSKALDFPPGRDWGTFPTVAILFNAGGWPVSGGGVVLPSYEDWEAVDGGCVSNFLCTTVDCGQELGG